MAATEIPIQLQINVKYKIESGMNLTEEQRSQLAKLVVDNIPLDEAPKEAAKEWKDSQLKQILKMGEFEKLCIEAALEQADDELIDEARKYAGAGKVNGVLRT
jgi:hypothetical protein